MKAAIYCLEENRAAVEALVKAAFPAAETAFVPQEELSGGELLVADHGLVHTLKNREADGYADRYVFFKGHLFDVAQAEALVQER